jgi:hypothetical protein
MPVLRSPVASNVPSGRRSKATIARRAGGAEAAIPGTAAALSPSPRKTWPAATLG